MGFMKNALIRQLDKKIDHALALKRSEPPAGWIKAVRISLGMSLEQLGNRMKMSRQGIRDFEHREKYGNVTLRTLKEVANALEMDLVYGFVPKDGSLEKLVERKAREIAMQMVGRNAQKLDLESQTKEFVHWYIESTTMELKLSMPKSLWD